MNWNDALVDDGEGDTNPRKDFYLQFEETTFQWRFGLCKIGRLLTLGGMSAVFECTVENAPYDCVIKLFDPPKPGEHSTEVRYWREIKHSLHPKLSHKHIIPCFDGGEIILSDRTQRVSQFFAFIVMKRASCTLHDYVKRKTVSDRGLSSFREEIRLIFIDILKGLHHMHSSGITHRDIKEGNILLSDDKWVVSDLGLARTSAVQGVTIAGGTYGYFRPGDEARSLPRGDYFALGVTLIRCLTGSHPKLVGVYPNVIEVQSFNQSTFVDLHKSGLPVWAQEFIRISINGNDATASKLLGALGAFDEVTYSDSARNAASSLYERISKHPSRLPTFKDKVIAAMIRRWENQLETAITQDRFDVILRESFLYRAISLFESAESAVVVARYSVSSFWMDDTLVELTKEFLHVQPESTARIFVFDNIQQLKDSYYLLSEHFRIYGKTGALFVCLTGYFDDTVIAGIARSSETRDDLQNRDFGILQFLEDGAPISVEAVLGTASFTVRETGDRTCFTIAANVKAFFDSWKRVRPGEYSPDGKVWRLREYSADEWQGECDRASRSMCA